MDELKISQEDIRFFEANGYLIIEDLIDESHQSQQNHRIIFNIELDLHSSSEGGPGLA